MKNKLHIGYIGLGKMGSNMVERMCETGYTVSAFDPSESARDRVNNISNVTAYSNYDEMINSLPNGPKTIWMMVPSAVVQSVITEIAAFLKPNDILIDGGNTNFQHTLAHADLLSEQGIHFMDVGVSGGPAGARSGACMMIGGDKGTYDALESLFIDLCVPDGYGYMGPVGSGHFVKMVHNGIEYGMMQAIAEGFNVMKHAQFNLDLTKITQVYGHGSVISSSLIDWLHRAYQTQGPDLESISGSVNHSGEGEWTIDYAQSINQPVPVIEQSLQFRKDSQTNPSYTGQVVSALRNQFGGHDVSL